MEKIKSKSFEDWLYEEVGQAFGVIRNDDHQIFSYFDTLTTEKTDPRYSTIENYRYQLRKYVDTWNEDELKFMFISRFIGLIDFFSPNYKVFTQRPMSVQYENGTKTTSGKVEFMLAKGIQTPKKPFFFLHEYKQENRKDNDPLGQLLIAMVAAQAQNADNETLYGCYVSGRSWFFVILENKEYAVSRAYDATEKSIYTIFAILLWFKQKAEEKFGV
jgi:hypothetical protein